MTSAALDAFHASLYAEHLEEAASLRDRCRGLARQRDLNWTELAPFEERIEAHLDALVVGGEAGLAACRDGVSGRDPGECFVALSLLGRRSSIDELAALLGRFEDDGDRRRFEAVVALTVELPVGADDALQEALLNVSSKLAAVGAAISGLRRAARPVDLATLLTSASIADLTIGLAVAGVTPSFTDLSQVRLAYAHADDAVRGAALLAGLRRQDSAALRAVLVDQLPTRLLPLLGLAGDRRATAHLLLALEQTRSSEAALSLGLLGDLSAVRPLLAYLEDDALADDVAEALFVITGVAPREDVREVDPVQEDELFERELQNWRETATPPLAAGGLPYGRSVIRLSHDPAEWAAALQKAGRRFTPGLRYRFGHPFDAATMFKSALLPAAPIRYRRWFLEEPAVRQGVDVPTAAFLPVWHQQRALHTAARSEQAAASRGAEGGWYVAGQLQ